MQSLREKIMFERLFKLKENKTTVSTELMAGATTFVTMCYIIFVQPIILSAALPKDISAAD